jgi:hypothetical protein
LKQHKKIMIQANKQKGTVILEFALIAVVMCSLIFVGLELSAFMRGRQIASALAYEIANQVLRECNYTPSTTIDGEALNMCGVNTNPLGSNIKQYYQSCIEDVISRFSEITSNSCTIAKPCIGIHVLIPENETNFCSIASVSNGGSSGNLEVADLQAVSGGSTVIKSRSAVDLGQTLPEFLVIGISSVCYVPMTGLAAPILPKGFVPTNGSKVCGQGVETAVMATAFF